jgi:serine/threonine protein kinase
MNFTPQNICGFLIRSRLMTLEEMRAMYQRWLAEAGPNFASLSRFTKWLVAQQYVTDYQATLLAKGHGDPAIFFLGQYKILERLGRGRMAGVYKAMHTLGQIVAIKVLPPSRVHDPVMLGRFQREARLALRLKHPNVVRSFQIGQAGGLYFLVMEYLEGETLEEILQRRGRLPPPEAVRIIHQALMGLVHIHDLGMVHRDVKPANLMLVPQAGIGDKDTTERATVKILDIGLGRELFEERERAREDRIELTGEGVILGTPDYLAPEQARDSRSADIRADIYSLGCVLYHLLTGQPPFPDTNLINQMVRHATETPKALQQFNPAIPDGLQQILNYMIAKQPAQRYSNPERAAQALQMVLMAGSQAPAPIDEAPQMRNYLTWLETAPREPDGGQAQPVPLPVRAAYPHAAPAQDRAGLPVAKPLTSPIRSSRPTPTPSTRSAAHRKKHKKHRRHAHVPIAQPAPLSGPQMFDVELVAIPGNTPVASARAPESGKTLGLTHREWALAGLGAAALTIAILIGVVIAWLLRPGL